MRVDERLENAMCDERAGIIHPVRTILVTEGSLSDTAKDAVRLTFNPSGNARVNLLKMLAAALITEYEWIMKDNPAATREAAVAITNLQTASMWGVLAATKNL